MSYCRVGNTGGHKGHEYPAGGPKDFEDTPFANALRQVQVRIKGPACGPSGLVLFGAHAVGEIRLMDEPLVQWTISIEPRQK